MATSKWRGHDIYFKDGAWYYKDCDSLISSDKNRKCGHCKKENRVDGHDVCLGELDGLANACCGHGDKSEAYIQFYDGIGVYGEDAIIIQNILQKGKFNSSLEDKIKFLKGCVEYLEENKFEYFKGSD